MAQRQLLSDHPAHRDPDDMRRGKPDVFHQRGGVVREHRDAVVDIRLLAQSGAALVEGEHAKLRGACRGETGEHRLIALRAMNHDQRRAISAYRVSKFNSVDACPFHCRSAAAQLLPSGSRFKIAALKSIVCPQFWHTMLTQG